MFVAISCSRLSNPPDGSVIHGGTSVGDLVRYSCNRGFNLKGGGAGGDTRVCSTDGTWTGTAPICRSESCGSANKLVPRV